MEPETPEDEELLQLSERETDDQDLVFKYSKTGNKLSRSTIIASALLVLALVALFVLAIAAIGLGARGQDTHQDSSSLQQMVQTLQATIDTLLKWSAGTFRNPVRSCKDLPSGTPSGDYWILADGTSDPVQIYCAMNRTSCSCNPTGVWMRVANLDMTDRNQNCPVGFRLITTPRRTCGRTVPDGSAGCASAIFQTYRMEYSHVCGRVIGYQDSSPDAFGQYESIPNGTTIDSVYVDGVSLTHGQSPRQHIWTFAGALEEIATDPHYTCPCTQPEIPYPGMIPPFVGQDYFCDTGSRGKWSRKFYADDPLWDGQGCGGNSTCCEFNNPPWFCKQLPQPTTDDIELRICGDQSVEADEDTPIERVEIYIR